MTSKIVVALLRKDFHGYYNICSLYIQYARGADLPNIFFFVDADDTCFFRLRLHLGLFGIKGPKGRVFKSVNDFRKIWNEDMLY